MAPWPISAFSTSPADLDGLAAGNLTLLNLTLYQGVALAGGGGGGGGGAAGLGGAIFNQGSVTLSGVLLESNRAQAGDGGGGGGGGGTLAAGAVSEKPVALLKATAVDSAAHFQEEAEGPAAQRMEGLAAAAAAFAASMPGEAVPQVEMAAA